MAKKLHFKEIETYKHYYAKYALKRMLENGYMNINPLRIDIESKFCMNGMIVFIPDLAVYEKEGLSHLFEVVHSNPVSKEKLEKMINYFNIHKYTPKIHEIKAEFILKKIIN